MTAGRFAPSPSGDLHVGNLRTALLAWLFARSEGRPFLIRIEDLDRVRPGAAERQLADLRALGLDHDGVITRQSERTFAYDAAVESLQARDLVYECFCTRREIQHAASAPHAPAGAYPGTCRHLTAAEREQRRRHRPPALRLRSEVDALTVTDRLTGTSTGPVDDLVLRRTDGVAAYNLAVVVDDADQGVGQVVRGDDLLPSTPRQVHLAQLLDLPVPEYVHVPLALNRNGQRLAKRDGAVTMSDLAARGRPPEQLLTLLAASLELALPGEAVTLNDLLDRFDPLALSRDPWTVDPDRL